MFGSKGAAIQNTIKYKPQRSSKIRVMSSLGDGFPQQMPVPALRTEPQQPTWCGVRIKRSEEAKLVMHAVALDYAPLIHSRLQEDERRAIVMEGSVFVWEERDEPSETNGSAIIRWTDGRRWGPSRVQGEFLIYHENLPALPPDINELDRNEYIASRLIKQTFSARVDVDGRRKKWHLVAYYTQRADRRLPRVLDIEPFKSLRNTLPPHQYESARASRPRGRGNSSQSEEIDEDDSDPSNDPPPPPASSLSSMLAVNQTHGEAPHAGPSQIPHSAFRSIAAAPAAFPAPASGSMGGPTARPPGQPQTASEGDGQAGSEGRRFDLAPLVYDRMAPYPPRHPVDSVALRSLDVRVRLV